MTDYDVTGTLTVLQGAHLGQNVFVATQGNLGPTAVQGDLVLSGASAFQNTLQVDGPLVVDRVDVASHAVLETLRVTEVLDAAEVQVTGAVEGLGDVNVEGACAVSGDVTLNGALVLTGGPVGLAVAGAASGASLALSSASVANDLNVGAATVTLDMTLSSGMTSNGAFGAQLADVDGDLTATGRPLSNGLGSTVTSQLSVTGEFKPTQSLAVTGELRMADALVVEHLQSSIASSPAPTVGSATIYDMSAVVDTGAVVALDAGASDNSGAIVISHAGAGTFTAWRLSTVTVTFGRPFAAPPFVLTSQGFKWGTKDAPALVWVTSVTTTGFTLFVSDLGATYDADQAAVLYYFAVGSVA